MRNNDEKVLLPRNIRGRRLSMVSVLACLGATLGWAPFAAAQTQYAGDGTPSALEEQIRWLVNRGRFNSAAENAARGTSYTDITDSTGPLAPNQALILAARHHSEDMARNNAFQHATVTGSAYYNPLTQPDPWDRMEAEGYSWNAAGENIAAGYGGAEEAYVAWWNSTGHRVNMYGTNLREIGNGYFYLSSSSFGRYYTMDLGSSGNTNFFSDTLFNDANGNGAYDQDEGKVGVSVKLLAGSTLHSYFDISSKVGSFAIPIQKIAVGTVVQVIVSNTTAASVQLSIPRSYQTYTNFTLESGQLRLCGSYVQPATSRNVGWRDLTPPPPDPNPPILALTRTGSDIVLRWTSQTNVDYVVRRSTNLFTWASVATNSQVGSNTNLTWRDTGARTNCRQAFYRLLARPK